MERTIKRGDIYYAKLNPVVGSEQGGKHRPVLIISNDKGNKHSTTVIVAAITGMERAKAKLPTHIIAKGYEYLDKQRLQEYIGTFDRRFMLLVDDALAISIGISKKD